MTLGAARVIWSINDLSMFVDEIVRGYVTMVVRTQRGPVSEANLVSTSQEYYRKYGKKVPWTTDPLVVEMALRQGARLNLIRAAHYADPADRTTLTAVKAAWTFNDRGDNPNAAYIDSIAGPFDFDQKLSGRTIGTEIGPFTFVTGSYDTVSLSVNGGEAQDVVLSGTLTTIQVANLINAGTDGITASALYDEGSGQYLLKLEANTITHSLEVLAVEHDCYTILGLTEDTYDANPGTDFFTISVDGGADQTLEITPPGGVEGDFTLTTGQMVLRINTVDRITGLQGIEGVTASNYEGKLRITSNTTGDESSIQVKECTARSVLGYDLTERVGTEVGTALPTLTVSAKDEGVWGNSLKITFSASSLYEDLYFNMRVSYDLQGDLEEWYPDVSMDPMSDRYVVNFVNEQSFLVSLTDEHSANDDPLNMPAFNGPAGTYLDGGYDGMDDFSDADWIGEAQAQTGIYAADMSYMSMDLMIPGTTSPTVYDAMITYCLNRGDMMAYGQTPYGNDPEDTVNWRMGYGSYEHPAFNSHRFSLWFGRPLVFDDMDSSKRYIPNLGHLAACLCRTDNDYGSSWAPVGPRRGVVQLVEGIDFNIQDYRSTAYSDLFAEYGINYLMISKIPGIEGAMFWEQRTTQRVPSATRELNVMRFITVINRTIVPILRTFIFEPNHPVTWREIHRVLQPAFDDWKQKYAIYDYCLQTDRDAFFDGGVLKNAVLNSGLDIDRGIYRCRALIQPTRAIYYLDFELGVLRTGESFENYQSMKYLPGWVRQ